MSADLEGLPPELMRVLRDPTIRIDHPGQRDLDLMRYVYDNVPSNTASALTTKQWGEIWLREYQRANRAEAALDELRSILDEAAKTEERLRLVGGVETQQ